MTEILDDELDDRPIELVIDDASHRYTETRSSFETLFPRLAPGAFFVIEDWSGLHLTADAVVRNLSAAPAGEELSAEFVEAITARLEGRPTAPKDSLDRLGAELVVARASRGDTIREVTINEDWIVVERGADQLDSGFRFADLIHDHFGTLAEDP